MNRLETARVLALMTAAWPNFNPSDATLELWGSRLANMPSEDAAAVASLLIDEIDWFPSIAQFLSRWRDLIRNRQLTQPLPELEPPSISEEQARRNLDRLRELLGEVPTEPVIDPKYVGLPKRHRPPGPPPEFCSSEDHGECGHGPLRPSAA